MFSTRLCGGLFFAAGEQSPDFQVIYTNEFKSVFREF